MTYAEQQKCTGIWNLDFFFNTVSIENGLKLFKNARFEKAFIN
jgi:hypothetical protein